MEVTVTKTKLDETKTREGVKSLLYKARINPSHDLQAEDEAEQNSSLYKTHSLVYD